MLYKEGYFQIKHEIGTAVRPCSKHPISHSLVCTAEEWRSPTNPTLYSLAIKDVALKAPFREEARRATKYEVSSKTIFHQNMKHIFKTSKLCLSVLDHCNLGHEPMVEEHVAKIKPQYISGIIFPLKNWTWWKILPTFF